MKDLKAKTIRGGAARLVAQAANFALRLISLTILARLLGPKEYGLVGMVTAFTGVLGLFRDFGLSSAAVQRANITEEQLSTLFWINLAVGSILSVLAVVMAPAIAEFYHEPRLVAVTVVMAAGFLFNAAGVQHSVHLQRQMRFTAMAVINTVSLIVGTVVAIGGAKAGYGYWALVAMTVTTPFVNTVGLWLATAWIPGRPRRGTEMRSMMRFGGTLTLNGLIVYIASNLDKVLLGRFWGVDALGIYGRAYQLINIPTDNLNSAAGEVAFAGLSRIQDDPGRLRSYFLKGYSLVLAMTLPITVACALFADDVVLVLLGPKWKEAVPIFRLLAPTILVFAMTNPLSWLLPSIGRAGRLLKIGLVMGPFMIAGYLVGLPYGPSGVALGYSATMMVLLIPVIAWSVHDTAISFRDILRAVAGPLISSFVAGGAAYGVRWIFGASLSPFLRLVVESTVVLVVFAGVLLFGAGQKALYLDLLRGMKGSPSPDEDLVSVG